MSRRAIASYSFPAIPSGCDTATGRPASELVPMLGSSGTSPSSSTPCSAAVRLTPPSPKTYTFSPLASTKCAMFSTNPRIGAATLVYMFTPLRTSASAISCGVETMTAPVRGICCEMLICASPVPGGMSTKRTSRGAHAVSRTIFPSAPITIGPRHTAARSSGMRNPIDMHFTP